VGWDEAVEEIWGEPTDRTRWRYVGLPGLDAMRHAQGDNVLAAALSVLMNVAEERKAELKATAMERLARANLTQQRRYTLVEIVEAYLPLHGPHVSDYNHLLLTEKYQMARQLAQTSFEKGQDSGKKETIRSQLEAWFGPLSEGARQRLEALPPDKLRELSLAMRGAKSLADLGLEDASNGVS
jgi:hypothetical protein